MYLFPIDRIQFQVQIAEILSPHFLAYYLATNIQMLRGSKTLNSLNLEIISEDILFVSHIFVNKIITIVPALGYTGSRQVIGYFESPSLSLQTGVISKLRIITTEPHRRR